MPPGSSADERKQGRNNLEPRQDGQHLPGELAVHRLVNVLIPRTHDLRRT